MRVGMHRRRQAGVTLYEINVVIAILAVVLVVMGLVIVTKLARSRRAACCRICSADALRVVSLAAFTCARSSIRGVAAWQAPRNAPAGCADDLKLE